MRDHILRVVDANLDEIFAIAKFMYENPELGNEEFKACQALCESFKKNENLALVKGSNDSTELWKNLVKVTRYAVK